MIENQMDINAGDDRDHSARLLEIPDVSSVVGRPDATYFTRTRARALPEQDNPPK